MRHHFDDCARKETARNLCALAFTLATLAACGYIGDPLPPSLEIPVAITNLQATQVSDKLVIRYSQPQLTTENLQLKAIEATELRAGPVTATGEFNLDQWAASASRFEVPPPKQGTVEMELPIREWAGRDVVVAVRVMGAKQRYSAWSNLVIAPVIAALTAPENLKATSRPDGIALTWQPSPGAEYRIFRGPTQIASAKAGEFVDLTAELDAPYTYQVQAFRQLNEKQTAEGPKSSPLAATLKDSFPPAAPTALQLIQGVASIEITWQRNPETDWKAYKIWRAEGPGAFTLLADAITQTSHSDRTAVRGKLYRYAISAVDTSGNESEKSQIMEFTLPE